MTWVNYGIAEKQINNRYTAKVNEPGLYSINKEIKKEQGTYINRIIYEDGSPAKDLRVFLVGENWQTNTLSTDNDGSFEINVNPDEEYTIYAYTYRDNYIAEYNGPKLKILGEGEILDDRS